MEKLLESDFDERLAGGRIQQRGAGAYTLCGPCNNFTGRAYARHFAHWCHQGMEIMVQASGRPTLVYMNYVFPLSVIKQICTMFFSVNRPQFREKHRALEYFVRNRESHALPENYKVYAYFMGAGKPRSIGVAGRLNIETGQADVFTELSFPPYGYVMAFKDVKPHPDLYDITFFRRYHYGEFGVVNLRLPVLPTHLPLPGDYRSEAEIERDAEQNDREARQGTTRAEA